LSGARVWGGAVIDDVSEEIRECLRHAQVCARKAAEQLDPELRRDFLKLEKHWLTLARSMGFSEQSSAFTKQETEPVS
jgi:hypothetical protein